MNDKLVSVIIPVFKAEKCLKRCIDSVRMQSYDNFEVLLIDDGSPDNCGEICDKYAETDNRIRVVHKKNAGVSAARNDGLRMASGDYIMFVDSDDELFPDALETMTRHMANNCDIVIGKTMCFFGNESAGIQNEDLQNRSFDLNAFINEMVQTGSSLALVVWGKLFKTNILKQKGLYFNELLDFGEDTEFICKYLTYCQKISTTDKYVYKYYKIDNESLSRKKRTDFVTPALMASDALKVLFNKEYGGDNAQRYADERKYVTMVQAIAKTFFYRLPIKEKIRAIRVVTDMEDLRETARVLTHKNRNARYVAHLIEKRANIRLFGCYTFIFNIKKKGMI